MASEYSSITGNNVDPASCYLLQFDGGAVPNPGKACGSAVIYNNNSPRSIYLQGGIYLEKATNNQAEYTGLLFGLQQAIKSNIRDLVIEGDSQLVVMQVSRSWNVRNEALLVYHNLVRGLIKKFNYLGIKHIPRAKNSVADKLADEGIERGESFLYTV
jgi:ribonuclease HI